MEAKTIVLIAIIGVIVLVGGVYWAENTQQYVWNFLRPFENAAESLAVWSTLIVLLMSAVLFAISIKAYAKNPSGRFLLVTLAFGLFCVKFLLKFLDFYYSPGHFFSQASQNVFDFFVLLAMVASLLKKG